MIISLSFKILLVPQVQILARWSYYNIYKNSNCCKNIYYYFVPCFIRFFLYEGTMYSVQRTIILGDHYKISEHHQFPWCHTSFIKPNFIGRFSWYHLIGFHDINKMNCELMLTYHTPALWQTGSRNLTGQKTLPTIWGTYMTLVTKYQISVTNSC